MRNGTSANRSKVSATTHSNRSGLRPVAGATMPSADFCPAVRSPLGSLSRVAVTQDRPPGVIPAAFHAQSPDLHFPFLMNMDFRKGRPARPTLAPHIRFLFIDSRFCSTLLSDPPSPERPCASLTLHLHQVG